MILRANAIRGSSSMSSQKYLMPFQKVSRFCRALALKNGIGEEDGPQTDLRPVPSVKRVVGRVPGHLRPCG